MSKAIKGKKKLKRKKKKNQKILKKKILIFGTFRRFCERKNEVPPIYVHSVYVKIINPE